MTLNLILSVFAGTLLLLSAFSSALQRRSLPGPLLALAVGVLAGPAALGLLTVEDFGVERGPLLEQASRLTLAVGLAGVALRLPHGYWRRSVRWVTVIIGLGMLLMLAVATGIFWGMLGLPFLTALLLGAIITPTDPVVTTPIVTGSMATENIPERVRLNLSSESGLNDGLGYLLVFLPILLLTRPAGEAYRELLLKVLLWEVLGAVAVGAAAGYAAAKLFVLCKDRGYMEESSYLGFIVPFGLAVLGLAKLAGTDGVLAVFIAAALFGQLIPEADEARENKMDDVVNRFFILPVFILLGICLPVGGWVALGWGAPVVVLLAVVLRRVAAVWALRPLLSKVHSKPETLFISWFGAVGVSALFYATLAERLTGREDIFVYATLAITVSVLVHGLTSAPFSRLLKSKEAVSVE